MLEPNKGQSGKNACSGLEVRLLGFWDARSHANETRENSNYVVMHAMAGRAQDESHCSSRRRYAVFGPIGTKERMANEVVSLEFLGDDATESPGTGYCDQ